MSDDPCRMITDSLLTSGPVRRAELLRARFTERDLKELTAEGVLVQVLRGVYLPAGLEDDTAARAAAIGLILPTGAAVCRETAAWIHGIDTRPPGAHRDPPRLQVVVPQRTTPLRRPGIESFASRLPPGDFCSVEGIPVTVPDRTALDVSRWSAPFVGLAALDAFAHVGLIDLAAIAGRLDAISGHRYVARARRLLGLCEPATESAGESWLRLRVIDAGLPRPRVQIPFLDDHGRELYRLDAGYDEHRVGIEYDGEKFHFRTVGQRQADEARRDDLKRLFGWTVVGFSEENVLASRPAAEVVTADLIGWTRPLLRRLW